MRSIWVQAYYGGNWNDGANAGLGALNLNNLASNASWNIGARPAKDGFGQKPGAQGRPASAYPSAPAS